MITSGFAKFPSVAGAPGIPGTLTPALASPINIRKRPMATAQLAARKGGIASISILLSPETDMRKKITPAMKTAPRATFQVTPRATTTGR